MRPSLLIAVVLLVLSSSSCSRTALNGDCPNGYARIGEACVCETDEACPSGYRCEEHVCICRGDACCPRGYRYSADSQTCVCREEACCPRDHRWLAGEARCTCGVAECCPDGYRFSEETKACECAGDACCPQGHQWDQSKKSCTCASTTCCPEGFVFDAASKDCVCAKTECCPPNHAYHPEVAACVCIGDTCCPTGFRKGPQARCICIDDHSCPPNQFCDPASGGCRCRNSAGCPGDHFCNALGFCQSFAACTSNLDCPQGTFCDVTRNRCIPPGPCTLDEHCALASVCNPSTMSCRTGCRDDGDCSGTEACVAGQCTFFCRNNSFCPVNEFCNPQTGRCASGNHRVDCLSCDQGPFNTCGAESFARCLSFVTEGQASSFCGHVCETEADCPSGFECSGVIYSCRSQGSCESVSSETITCKSYQVENEEGVQSYCTDSSDSPHVYFKACAPRSGFCPAIAAP